METGDLQELRRARAAAERFLKYRPRSVAEVKGKLRLKGFSGEVIAEVVRGLAKVGILDDAQFAVGWARSRLNKPVGVKRIRQELRQKEVAEVLIDEALADVTAVYDEADTIRQVTGRRLRVYAGLPALTIKRRLYAYLVRRGFRGDVIINVMHEMVR